MDQFTPSPGLLLVMPRALRSVWRPLPPHGERFLSPSGRGAFAVRPARRGWTLRAEGTEVRVNRGPPDAEPLRPDDVISDRAPGGVLHLFQSGRSLRHPALESAIAAEARDGDFLVFADWLQERGDPLGTTILQCATHGRGCDLPRFLLGQRLTRLKMRFCFWVDVALDARQPDWVDVLAALLLFPRGRFLRSLTVDVSADAAAAWQAAILRVRPAALRALTVGPLRWSA